MQEKPEYGDAQKFWKVRPAVRIDRSICNYGDYIQQSFPSKYTTIPYRQTTFERKGS